MGSWTRVDITRGDGVDDGDGYSADAECRAFYGPGELELYRHVQLQRAVKDAKLKVWYPGSWQSHSPRACFRTKLSDDNLFCEDAVGDAVVLKFRSNARITSVESDPDHCTDRTESDAPGKQHQMRWKSETQDIDGEAVYEHIIFRKSNSTDVARGGRQREIASGSAIAIELDTRPPKDCTSSIETSTNAQDEGGGDDSGLNVEKDSTEEMYSPPCITFQTPQSPAIDTKHARYHQQRWEWRNGSYGKWVPITSCWVLNSGKEGHLVSLPPVPNAEGREDASGPWLFPHQIDLSQVSTVLPVRQLQETVEDTKDEVVYDFGRELLGKVCITVQPSTLSPTVKLRVGETLAEATNDEEDHFEQCIDIAYTPRKDKSELRHEWVSCHLLAFRYVRVVIPQEYHAYVSVACQAHSSQLRQRGSFSYSGERMNLGTADLDTKIWQSALNTLHLCIHNNFIVDGKLIH